MLTFSLPRSLLREQWCVPAYRIQQALASFGKKIKVRAIGELAKIRSGTYIAEYKRAGSPYLRVDNIREFQINENPEDLVYVDGNPPTVSSRCVVEPNDILIARTGTLGKAALALEPQAGSVMSQHVTGLSCITDVLPGFVACCLNSPLGREQLIAGGFGSTRLELTHEALEEVKIPWIGNTSQRKIHTAVERAVDLNNKANAILQACVSEMEDLLGIVVDESRGLTIFDIPSISGDSLWTPRFFHPQICQSIDELERRFECIDLDRIANIARGKGTRIDDYVRVGIPFVRTTSLLNYVIDPFPDHYASEETYNKYKQPVVEGDILFSIEGKIGMSAYVLSGQRCVYKNHIERIRVKPPWTPLYVFLFLNTAIGKIQAERNAIIQATLPGMAHRLRDLRIPIRARMQNVSYQSQVAKLLERAKVAFSRKLVAVQKWSWAKSCLAESSGAL